MTSNDAPKAKPTIAWYQFGRGSLYPFIAIIGALVIGPYLKSWGINEYTEFWLGSMFKAVSAAWIGYRVSRGMLRIDPSSASENPIAYAVLHLARAVVVVGFVAAVCMGT